MSKDWKARWLSLWRRIVGLQIGRVWRGDNKPRKFGLWPYLLVPVGVLTGMVVWAAYLTLSKDCWVGARSSKQTSQESARPERARAWEKIETRLRHADGAADALTVRHLNRINQFFEQKQTCIGPFAEDALSWSGKWAFIQGVFDEGQSHQLFLREAFERHIFTAGDLQALLQAVVTGFLSELEGQENNLLVTLRADLSDDALPTIRNLPVLRSDAVFQQGYHQMLERVIPLLRDELQVAIGREVVLWIAGDIAGNVVVRVGSSVAVSMGVSSTILGTGAASGFATLGIGFVAGVVLDAIVDWILREAGYDPAAQLSGEVSAVLGRMQHLILNGEGGLYRELERVRKLRSRLRTEALRKLVLEEGR